MDVKTVERQIADYIGREYCFLVGRGTTAIYLALKQVEKDVGRGEVILPTIACPSLTQVSLLAGFKPVFADVCLEDYTLSIRSTRSLITSQTRAILPIHTFGHAMPMQPLLDLATEHKLYVIEDAAQALGGQYQGRKLGAWGDFSLLSFGGSKIVSAGGGGAILTDDAEFAAALEQEIAQLPFGPDPMTYSLKSLSHRNLFHGLVDMLRVNPDVDVSPAFRQMLPFYDELYVHRWRGDDRMLERIVAGLQALDRENALRVERAAAYFNGLQIPGLRHSQSWKESGVSWRYTLLVEDPAKLLSLTEKLRRSGIHASNHYWSVADFYAGEKSLPNTRHVSSRILNLWVDAVADSAYIQKSCDVIRSELA